MVQFWKPCRGSAWVSTFESSWFMLPEMEYFFTPASVEHQKREKAKARELRIGQWWKQELGKGLCYHCQERFKPGDLTMDHLIPIARGGKSSKNNCVPSCKECNTKKGYKTRAEMALEDLKTPLSKPDSDDSIA